MFLFAYSFVWLVTYIGLFSPHLGGYCTKGDTQFIGAASLLKHRIGASPFFILIRKKLILRNAPFH